MSDEVPKLWTTKDIAARLGVSRERARQLSHRDDWPKPVGEVGHIRLWSADHVEQWIKGRSAPGPQNTQNQS